MKLFLQIFTGVLHEICNFFLLAGIQLVVSIYFSSSVLMILKSVPKLLWLSSEDDGFETEAIAIRQKIIWIINISIMVLVYNLVQHCTIIYYGIWYGFWCGIVLFIFCLWLLTKKIICCSSLCSFLMSFIMSSILRCNPPSKMISLYSQG